MNMGSNVEVSVKRTKTSHPLVGTDSLRLMLSPTYAKNVIQAAIAKSTAQKRSARPQPLRTHGFLSGRQCRRRNAGTKAAPAATTAIRAYTLVNNHETAPPRSAMGPWRGAPIQGSITTRPTCGASLQRRSATCQSFTDCILREDGLREKASNSAEPVIGTDTGKQFKHVVHHAAGRC